MDDYYYIESLDAIRFSWNVLPPNKTVATRAVAPIGCLYTPIRELENLALVDYKPLMCQKCKAVLNPFNSIEFRSKFWSCVFCSTRNPFPREYAESISEDNLPPESHKQYSTIEYLISSKPTTLPAFVFLIDLCISQDELQAIKDSILQGIQFLPPSINIGLITFNRCTFVHELSSSDCPKSYVLRGDKEYLSSQILEMLGIGSRHDPRGPQATGAVKKFIQPIGECEVAFTNILDDLQADPWPVPADERALRATGTAFSVAITVLEALQPQQGSRLISFLGGPCTWGPGQVVGVKLQETIRNFVDLQKDNENCKYYKKAQKYYTTLAQRAAKSCQVIDIYGFTLDQFGLAEMKALSEMTGGYMLINEMYKSKVFKETFKKVFEKDANGDLKYGFNSEITVHTSKELKISGCLGPCTSLKKVGPQIAEVEIGQGGTTSWYIGGLDRNLTLAFYLDVPAPLPGKENVLLAKMAYLQFVTQYKHPSGQLRLRVTTVIRRFAEPGSTLDLIQGFDQEATCILVSRLGILKAETEEPPEVLRWLDKMLIRLISRFADFKKDALQSFSMPKEFALYPQFIYHLRRGNFIQTVACSPDESAYYRAAIRRENVTNSLVMIQPALLMYTFEDLQPQPVMLDIENMRNNVILLQDTFFHVVIWHGEHIHKWKELKYQDDPEYENFKKLLEAPLEDARLIVEDRFPAPNIVQTWAGHGLERLIKSKVNPSSHAVENSTCQSGDFLSDDASLKMFMDHLIKIVVTNPI